MIRDGDFVKEFFKRWEKRYGRGKALSILAARLGRAVFLMLKRGDTFDEAKFFHLSQEEAAARLSDSPKRKRRKRPTKQEPTSQPNPQEEASTC